MKWEALKEKFLTEMQRRLFNGATGPNMLELAVRSIGGVQGCEWNSTNAVIFGRYVKRQSPTAVAAVLKVISRSLDERGLGQLYDLRGSAPSVFDGGLRFGNLIVYLDEEGDWAVRSMTVDEEREHSRILLKRLVARALRGSRMTDSSLLAAREEVDAIVSESDGCARDVEARPFGAAALKLLRTGLSPSEVATRMGYKGHEGFVMARARATCSKKVYPPLEPTAGCGIARGSMSQLMGDEEFVQDGGADAL